jgi:alpha-beta hydrolase superfamily lysophospholipase
MERITWPDLNVTVHRREPAGEQVGAAWLQHGFARSPKHLSALTQRLVDAGIEVLAPHLPSLRRHRLLDDPDLLNELARRLPLVSNTQDGRLVLVGHSVGGAALSHVAALLLQEGPEPLGLVLLDPNESLTGLMEPAMTALGGIGIHAAVAPPNRCNRSGQAAGWLSALENAEVVEIPNGSHCDAEGRADLACRMGCGSVDPAAARMVSDLAVDWTHQLASR